MAPTKGLYTLDAFSFCVLVCKKNVFTELMTGHEYTELGYHAVKKLHFCFWTEVNFPTFKLSTNASANPGGSAEQTVSNSNNFRLIICVSKQHQGCLTTEMKIKKTKILKTRNDSSNPNPKKKYPTLSIAHPPMLKYVQNQL